jgi:hypothetical protein
MRRTPKKTYNQNGILGSQFRTPKSLTDTQSAVLSNKKANIKLIIVVVSVKNRFGNACLHLL